MADRQIFYDPSGRRRKRFRLAVGLFIALNVLTVAALFATIRVVPAQPPLPVALERACPAAANIHAARADPGADRQRHPAAAWNKAPEPRKVGAAKSTAIATP